MGNTGSSEENKSTEENNFSMSGRCLSKFHNGAVWVVAECWQGAGEELHKFGTKTEADHLFTMKVETWKKQENLTKASI